MVFASDCSYSCTCLCLLRHDLSWLSIKFHFLKMICVFVFLLLLLCWTFMFLCAHAFRYNEFDQPVCRVCDVVLKSESIWDAHQVSRKHREVMIFTISFMLCIQFLVSKLYLLVFRWSYYNSLSRGSCSDLFPFALVSQPPQSPHHPKYAYLNGMIVLVRQ